MVGLKLMPISKKKKTFSYTKDTLVTKDIRVVFNFYETHEKISFHRSAIILYTEYLSLFFIL